MTTYHSLRSDVSEQGIAWVHLNRPERANALGLAFWEEFPQLLAELDEQDVRVVVLAAEGRHFCAGADVELLESLWSISRGNGCAADARDRVRREILRLQDALTAIERMRVPVIAAVHGACIGAGVDLIAACDMRYAADGSRFSIKEVDFGIVADVGTLQRLRHVIGHAALCELAYTAEEFDVARAHELGLIGKVFPSRDALWEGVAALAARIAAKPALTVRGIKHNLMYSREHTVAEGLDYVATWNASAILNAECAAAIESARRQFKSA